MNGKKAKAIRQEAFTKTIGIPLIKYVARKLNPKLSSITIFLDKCTRKKYKQLKQEYRYARRV